jgi:hypothetical protein
MDLVALAALGTTLYSLYPVLKTTSSEVSDLHGNNGMKVGVTVDGSGIKDVTVGCVTNKVIFDDADTLSFSQFSYLDEYNVQSVAAGETFTADCNFVWSLWVKRQSDGFFLMGAGQTGKPQLGIGFSVRNSQFELTQPIPASITPDLSQYVPAKVTAVDGSYIIPFKWPWSWLQHRRIIHVIGRRGDSQLKWRIAPNGEPVIPDGGGFKIQATGPTNPSQWVITMKRGNPN